MMQTDFSIVTPSFNQAQFVGITLQSILDQRDVTIQHVVVDPGSTDGSREIIRKFPHAMLVEKKDSCQSEGINNGFGECTGRFIAWLNSDDIYPSSDVLFQVKQCFDTNPTVDVVYGNAVFIDDNGQFIRNYYVNGKVETLLETLQYQVGICQPAVFWRRSVYEKLGGLDESLDYQLDYEYWIRMAQANLKWKHLNIVLAAHRWWDGMKTSSKRDLSLQESLSLVKKKFGYVHFKWTERLAALEVSGSDGIINVKQEGDLSVKNRSLQILRQVNTDAKTLTLLKSSSANLAMQETLNYMQVGSIDTQPHFFDGTAMKWIEEPVRFVYPDDAKHPSLARRPEVRRSQDLKQDYVVYNAEPAYCISESLTDYQANQIRLAAFLDNCEIPADKTCVIVANGPSLKHSLNDELFAFDMIISNFAYKDERLLKHAKYFTIVNHTVAAQIYADWKHLDGITKVFPFWLGYHVPNLENTYYVNSTVVPEFSPDARRNLSWRSTVSYFNIQLAYSLGYRRILLVGFDNSYIQPPTVLEGDEILQKCDDPNHFMSNYFKGKTWQAADTGNMNDSYCEALSFAMNNDLEIINCTVGGQLHTFPRSTLSQMKSDSKKVDRHNQVDENKWQLLTPVEVSAIANFPLIKPYFTGKPTNYAALPKNVQDYLLSEAREVGRSKTNLKNE